MTVRVVILGYYGFGNTGDEAVLGGILTALKHVSVKNGIELTITVLSADSEQTKERYKVDSADRGSFKAIFYSLRKSDVFILGGGSLLQDTTGRGLSVLYYAGLSIIAKMLGKKVIFYAQGIGPVKRTVNRFLVYLAASATDFLSVRDNGSMIELRRLGVLHKVIRLTCDPAFALREGKKSTLINSVIASLPLKPVIGVMLRDWPGIEDKKYLISDAIEDLAERINASIVLLPMQQAFDIKLCQSVAALIKRDCYVLEETFEPEEMIALFGEFDLVIAMRLHALIFAAIAGVPMVGLGYDPKINAFLSQIGMQQALSIENLKTEDLTNQALEQWMARDEIKTLLKVKADEMRKQANEFAEELLGFLTERG